MKKVSLFIILILPLLLGISLVSAESGIIYDSQTGLEWYVGPDEDTTWDEARDWVGNLTVEGGGWRMPTREELRGLYKKGVGTRNMDPAFKMTGWFVWSGETKGSRFSWLFSFDRGVEHWADHETFGDGRAFAVRSRK